MNANDQQLEEWRRAEGAQPTWMTQAICAQTDPEAFFPNKGEDATPARRICNGDQAREIPPCPVREACLDYALTNDVEYGIWGGTTVRQRRLLAAGKTIEPKTRPCRTCGEPAFGRNWYCSDDCRRVARRESVRRYDQQKARAA